MSISFFKEPLPQLYPLATFEKLLTTYLYLSLLYDVFMRNRAEAVKAIRLVWDSLDTHLDPTVGNVHENKCCNEAVGKPSFHKKCLKEYHQILGILIENL